VQRGPQGTFVYLAGKDGKAEQRPVTVGLTVGDLALVDKGLAPGDSVVIEGQNQLRPGSLLQARGGQAQGGGHSGGQAQGGERPRAHQ
jgi:membrane fusion protein, multidrug efflux system